MEEAEKNGEVEVYQTFELSDGARTVTILASKDEEERISKDQAYATHRFLSAVGEQNVEHPLDEDEFNQNATLLLIECIRDRFEKFVSCRNEKNVVYNEIQDELRSYGYNLSVEKIRSKWNNLVTTYKRIKERHKAGLVNRRTWDYFQPLEDLLGPTYDTSGAAGLSLLSAKSERLDTPVSKRSDPYLEHCIVDSPSVSHTTISIASTQQNDLKRKYADTDGARKRQEMMELYLREVKEKDRSEKEYRKRKERRDRMKVQALRRIGNELEIISETQKELLKKQDTLLEAINKKINSSK